MSRHHSVLVCLLSRNKLVEESEEFVDLRLREIRIVGCVLHLKSIDVLILSGDYIRQRAQARVADGDPHRVAAMLLQKLNENGLAVKSALAPAAECNFVDFPDHSVRRHLNDFFSHRRHKRLSKGEQVGDASVYRDESSSPVKSREAQNTRITHATKATKQENPTLDEGKIVAL
jgi:hypothetical protein